jgi:hypothetical protein
MNKATKIDADTWRYRGFTITADYRSTSFPGAVRKTRRGVRIQDPPGCEPRFADAGLWWRPTLAAAVELIDEWYERADSGLCSEHSRIPGRVAAARACVAS